jgi:hypothetical protein
LLSLSGEISDSRTVEAGSREYIPTTPNGSLDEAKEGEICAKPVIFGDGA